jgi:hypothetical protein
MNTLQLSPDEVARRAMQTPAQRKVDAMQRDMMKLPQVECPLTHEFVGLFYLRTVCVPAGTLVVSKIFKADFPFFISKGRVSVWVEGEGVVRREAPFWGFTKSGTRRIIYHHTDVVWSTFHRTDCKNEEQAEAEIIYTPENEGVEISAEMMEALKENK